MKRIAGGFWTSDTANLSANLSVEVLTCQANPHLDFHRAVLAPSHTVVVRVRLHLLLTETLASRETGAAGYTVAFRPAHAHLRARLGRSQPYAPAGWRGGGG